MGLDDSFDVAGCWVGLVAFVIGSWFCVLLEGF